jgi:threonine dehydrogenase-like Zn-dependent dehydrogenase
MPREIVTTDGRSFRFREYELAPLGTSEVRVRVSFAAPKHGTEAHLIAGSSLAQRRFDPELRLFLPTPRPAEPPGAPSERGIGNIVVGTVAEAGEGAKRFRAGDRVFGYAGIREVHQAPEEEWYSAELLSDEEAVCVDPAHVALVAVRDGNIRVGDTVAVFGLGAIGLMAARIAMASGAYRVFAVDPMANRRACAEAAGADLALDPTMGDVALEIKRATAKKGVDVSIETSGNARALHEAIRCIRQCGTVVHVPWGPSSCAELHLDEEFHLNRPTLIGSQAWSGWHNPDRSFPLWDHDRAYKAAIDLFRLRRASAEGIVTPVVPFDDAPEALGRLFLNPGEAIKLGVRLTT